MPHMNPERHREYNREWLHDPAHPERLERKRQRDLDRYHANREAILTKRRLHYQKNRKRLIEKQLQYKEEARLVIAEARSNPCTDCGGSFPPAVMQFHHLDPTTKKIEVPQASTANAARAEMAKCVLLCANCHALRHA